jgi:DNA-binding transcriptional ArsR family regulator
MPPVTVDAPFEPPVEELSLTAVMHALSDEARLTIVRTLAREEERVCGTFELGIAGATRSHHLKVLRETGVTHTRIDGKQRLVSLRRADLDARFPGLLAAVLAAG